MEFKFCGWWFQVRSGSTGARESLQSLVKLSQMELQVVNGFWWELLSFG